MGNIVHETLRKCYGDLRFTKVSGLADLLACCDKIWQQNWHDSMVIIKEDVMPEHYRASGRKMLETCL